MMLFMISIATFLQAPVTGPDATRFERRFHDEYPSSVRVLRTAYTDARGSGVLTHKFRAENGQVTETLRYDFALSGPSWKVTETRLGEQRPGQSYQTIYCSAPNGSFRVKRVASGAAPELNGIEAGPDDSLRKAMQSKLGPYLFAPVTPFGDQVALDVDAPFLVLDSVDGVERDGQDLVRSRYHWRFAPKANDREVKKPENPAVKKAKKPAIKREAEILFAPSEGWIIREYAWGQLDLPLSLRRGKIEYADRQKGVLVPKHVSIIGGLEEKSFTFETLVLGPTPPSEFTLESVGLPNLASPPTVPPQTNSGARFFGAASIAAVLAIGLKILAARSRRAVPGTGGAP